MKIKIYKQLLKWKESKDRKPLMLVSGSAFIPCIIQKKAVTAD